MKGRLLIAENDLNLQKSLKLHMTKEGYQATVASSREECICILESSVFDLIVLDLHISNGTGLFLLKEIRDNNRFSRIPVLIVTEGITKDVIQEAKKYENLDFMIKPFKLEEIAARIQKNIPLNLSYQNIKDIAANLHLPDNSVFTESGFGGINKKDFTPYTKIVNGHKTCFMIKANLSPKAASQLAENNAEAHMMVFVKGNSQWQKIWPLKVAQKPVEIHSDEYMEFDLDNIKKSS